jgi:hypothetical protein
VQGFDFIKSYPAQSLNSGQGFQPKLRCLPVPYLIVIKAVLIFSGFLFSPTVYAATLDVGPGETYTTIQSAIDAASNGDIIQVSPGLYAISSTILINKSVTLEGPQAGVDPRPSADTARTAGNALSEAILDGGGTLSTILRVAADNVVIDGFEVRNGTGDLVDSPDSNPIKQSPVVKNNIIHNSSGDEGIQLRRTSSAIIEYNHVYATAGDAINLCCNSTGGTIRLNEVHNISSPDAAIYVYDSLSTTIEENLVYDVINNDGIKLGNKSGANAGSSPGGSILNNVIHDTKQDGISVYQSGISVTGNEVYHSTSENGAIHVAFAVSNITVSENYIHDNTLVTSKFSNAAGILIRSTVNVASTSISENKLEENTPFGLTNHAAAVLTVIHNWWGNATGPTHASNPSGSGDAVSGNVTFSPWCANSSCALPIATLADIPASSTNSQTVDITVAGTNVVAYKYKLDAGDYGAETNVSVHISLSDLTEGSHTLSVIGKDVGGNWQVTPTTYSWTVDATAPTATVSYDVTAPTNTDVIATLHPSEDVSVTSGGGLTHTFSANGDFTFEFADAAGNTGNIVASVSNIDKTAPVITLSDYTRSPTNQDVVVSAITNEGSLNADSHTFIENGSFDFIATDVAGNSTTQTVTISNIDKTVPTVTIMSPLVNTTTAPSVTLKVTTNENATCTYNLDSTTDQTMDTTEGTSHSQSLSSLAAGTHTVQFTCIDPAGNGTTSASISWMVASATDNTLESGGSDAVFDSATDGQADLPSGITDITLSDDTVIDLSNAVETITPTVVTIGGQTVTVTQEVTLQSGVDTEPIVITNEDVGNVSVIIPDDTNIQGPVAWDGTIEPPKTEVPSGNTPAGFQVGSTVISVGSSDGTLVFNNSVTILFTGVTGEVGYKPAGSNDWVQITNTCGGTFDSPDDPVSPGECTISNGTDTKILTYHFTTFGSLIAIPAPPSPPPPTPVPAVAISTLIPDTTRETEIDENGAISPPSKEEETDQIQAERNLFSQIVNLITLGTGKMEVGLLAVIVMLIATRGGVVLLRNKLRKRKSLKKIQRRKKVN